MTIDVQELLKRVRDLEIESLAALTTPVTADAVEYLMHTQEEFPYFTNRVSGFSVADDSEEFEIYVYEITMRLVTAHATQGYEGEPESDLYLYIPQVVNYFNSRRLLQTTNGYYDAALTHLIRSQIVAGPGFRIFTNAGISAQQVGTEFVLSCEFEEQITQAFY